MENLTVTSKSDPRGIIILKVSGFVDASNINRFDEELYSHIKRGTAKIVVDCSDLQYINSMGMGILLEARQLAAKRNGDVVILNLPKKISKVFEILGFNEIFKLYTSEEEALKAF